MPQRGELQLPLHLVNGQLFWPSFSPAAPSSAHVHMPNAITMSRFPKRMTGSAEPQIHKKSEQNDVLQRERGEGGGRIYTPGSKHFTLRGSVTKLTSGMPKGRKCFLANCLITIHGHEEKGHKPAGQWKTGSEKPAEKGCAAKS